MSSICCLIIAEIWSFFRLYFNHSCTSSRTSTIRVLDALICSSNQLTHFMITASALSASSLRLKKTCNRRHTENPSAKLRVPRGSLRIPCPDWQALYARVETFSHTQRRGRRYACWYHPLIEVTWSGDKLAMEAHPMFASVRSISSLIMLST